MKERNGHQSTSIAAEEPQPEATPAPALPLLRHPIGALWGVCQGPGKKNMSQTHRSSSACHQGFSTPEVGTEINFVCTLLGETFADNVLAEGSAEVRQEKSKEKNEV